MKGYAYPLNRKTNRRDPRCTPPIRAPISPTASDAHRFFHDGHWYEVNWQTADDSDARFFRPTGGLGLELIERAKARLAELGDAAVELDYTHLGPPHLSDVRNLIGQSGELTVDLFAQVTAKQIVEHLLVCACTDAGESLPTETAERLLRVPGRVAAPLESLRHAALLQKLAQREEERHCRAAEQDNKRYYEEENEKLERWAEDRRIALDLRIRQLDQDIKELRKAARQLPTLREKMEAKKALKQLERERDKAMLDYHEEKKQIEAEEDRLLEAIESALHMTAERLHLFADRLELGTPGGLPNTLTVETMDANSVTRNETLVNLLSRYFPADPVSGRQNMIERRGEGVPTILGASERLSTRRPLYEQNDSVELRLTIWAASREMNGLTGQFAE